MARSKKRITVIGTLYKQHSRWGVVDRMGLAPTMTASMGMGGGFVPMVVRKWKNGKSR